MGLFLNWFAIEGLPEELELPCQAFPTWEDSEETIRELRQQGTLFRRRAASAGCEVIAYGSPLPEWPSVEIRLPQWPALAGVLIEQSLAAELRRRDMHVQSEPIEGVSAHNAGAVRHDELLVLKTGVRLKSYCLESPFRPGVTINWHVAQEFAVSLSDNRLAAIALDQPAIVYQPNAFPIPSAEREPELGSTFLGTVHSVPKGDVVHIKSRSGEITEHPRRNVTLEPTSRVLRLYDNAISPTSKRNVFRRVQQLSYALDQGGSRNPDVFRDRMSAIRRFLASDLETETSFVALLPASPTLRLHLRPTKVQ